MSNPASSSQAATPFVDYTHNYLQYIHHSLSKCCIPDFYPLDIDSWDSEDVDNLFDTFELAIRLITALRDVAAELHFVLARPYPYAGVPERHAECHKSGYCQVAKKIKDEKRHEDTEKFQRLHRAEHEKTLAGKRRNKQHAHMREDTRELDDELANTHIDETFLEGQKPSHSKKHWPRKRYPQAKKLHWPRTWGEVIDGQIILTDAQGRTLPYGSSYATLESEDKDTA